MPVSVWRHWLCHCVLCCSVCACAAPRSDAYRSRLLRLRLLHTRFRTAHSCWRNHRCCYYSCIAVTACLRQLCDQLEERGIVSAFGFAPSDDIGIATAYCATGFRKTVHLSGGIYSSGERKDAILWTRKLVNPADEE